jgi:hypothetical protein
MVCFAVILGPSGAKGSRHVDGHGVAGATPLTPSMCTSLRTSPVSSGADTLGMFYTSKRLGMVTI